MGKLTRGRVGLAALLALVLGCGRSPVKTDDGSPADPGEPFLFALNGEFPENDFLQNAVVFETPFMTMEYERKHTLDDASLVTAANFQWARQIRRDRPARRIILRYGATTWGKVPHSFDQYLAAEMATLSRFLALARREGVTFDLAEFGNEFNGMGQYVYGFTADQVVEYYDRGVRLLDSLATPGKVIVDLIPVYALNDSVFSPGGGHDLITYDGVMDDFTFLRRLTGRGTPFFAVGIELQPGAHTFHRFACVRPYLEGLLALGCDIYVWEFWALSQPLRQPTPMESGVYGHNAPPGGYSEAWQAEVLGQYLDYFRTCRRVIGFNYMTPVDGLSPGYGSEPYATGFLRADGSRKASYDVLMRFVRSVD
jgi:hypothetical protein